MELQHHDHGGVGHLTLVNATGLLATWRFTLGQNLHAIRLVEHFQAQLESHVTGQAIGEGIESMCALAARHHWSLTRKSARSAPK